MLYHLRFSVELVGSPYIFPGRPRILRVTFQPSYAGRYEDRLELVFMNLATKARFVIHRRLFATVGDQSDHEQLQPTAPYTRRKRVPLNIDGPIRRGLRPPTWTKTRWVNVLPNFDVPRQITDILYKRGAQSRKDVLALLKGFLSPDLNLRTYGSHPSRQDLDAYAMEGVSLRPKHPRYELEVQGLAENRPSVLVGDFILVRQDHATDRTWFQGRVHQVYENYVSLRFDDSFSTYRGNSFEVRFVLNRLSLRRMHAALINKNNPVRLLFPGPEHIRNLRRMCSGLIDKISPINRDIGGDPEQLEAVAAIVNMPPGSPPFVIFGPPGTGKTVTLVESMHQLLANDNTTRLLVCAPNNSAADLLTQKLSTLGPSVVLRLNSLSRKLSELPKSLHRFAIINDNEVFAMPTAQDIRKYRVVVSTCITAGVPGSLGIERGYYSHIFVDEAGQAMEPTVMVPLKELADDKTNVVLAGDNKQLGPIVHSGLASVLGLKTSYLARIMDREIYDLDGKSSVGGRGVTIVKLVRNFRSHPAILEFSNEHFYNNELQYCGNPILTRSLQDSNELPKKKFPLIFHGIIGKDQREASSPSFFNIEEASQVKKYCINLISDRKNGIRAEHIAVITPYHAQRIKILNLLSRDHTTREIKVGSVEEFQGQERRIVIISTVRSNTDFIGADINRMLGFVASPHRFNVAITRAQALLIVIGNPMVLSLDPLWRAFLNYVYRGGGWRGKTISWDPAGAVDPFSEQGYDGETRQRAAGEAEETIARLKALITRKNGEIEDGFQFELDDSDEETGHFGFGEGAVFREED
ncbi:RNA helicase [Lentinula edodes]|nr:RNA helicase [Lentinula edodes]